MSEQGKPVLSDHVREGKLLIPRLTKMGAQMIDWESQYLPEHLWLAYLIHDRRVSEAAAIFNAACDLIDEVFQPGDKGHVFLGYVSDFAFIPDERRTELLKALKGDDLATVSVQSDFRQLIGLYSAGPARWLALDPDGERSLSLLQQLVALLREQKTGKAAQCRILGFNRLLKHNMIFLTRNAVDDELIKGLQEYPNTDEEMSQRVEQFIRIAMNMNFEMRPRTGWAPGFWTTNLNVVACQ